jgi:GH24 family phage-related lysozyme (muramidase)|tara:strand:- start:1030 stop:1668 length:639 start_codon:yes stop_codon:yes gene_type:complete
MEKFFAILFGLGGVGVLSYFFRDKIEPVVTGTITSFSTITSAQTHAFLTKTGNNPEKERQRIIDEAWSKLRKQLEKTEGYRNCVYLDTRGLPTVGIGHLILPSDNLKMGDCISDARVEQLYKQDAQKAFNAAIKQADDLGRFTSEFIVALTEVNFQLGTGWTKEFKNTYAKLKRDDWQGAIANLKRSKWNSQTPVRVANFINAITVAYTTAA